MTAESGSKAASPSGAGRWLRRAGLAAFLVFAAVIGGAYLLPREPEVTRSVTIAAPPAAVFPLVADLRRFPEWSPWFAADPAAAVTFTGPLEGVGQTLSWQSKLAEVGWGTMIVTRVEPATSVEVMVAFADQGSATSLFRLAPAGAAATKVTWGFRTDLGFSPLNRYSGLWMDNIVGPDFERGLARLKARAEAPARSP